MHLPHLLCDPHRSQARSSAAAPGAQICLPDWPWWNRHPLKWLEAPEDEELEKEEKKKVKKVKDKGAKASKAK